MRSVLYSLAELQELARAYNHRHTPIALKQPKAALYALLEQRRIFEEGREGERRRRRSAWTSSSRRWRARGPSGRSSWRTGGGTRSGGGARKSDGSAGVRLADRGRVVMAHELVEAEHELLEHAQMRLDGAKLGPEFDVAGHLCFVAYFVFAQLHADYTVYSFCCTKTLEAIE